MQSEMMEFILTKTEASFVCSAPTGSGENGFVGIGHVSWVVYDDDDDDERGETTTRRTRGSAVIGEVATTKSFIWRR